MGSVGVSGPRGWVVLSDSILWELFGTLSLLGSQNPTRGRNRPQQAGGIAEMLLGPLVNLPVMNGFTLLEGPWGSALAISSGFGKATAGISKN